MSASASPTRARATRQRRARVVRLDDGDDVAGAHGLLLFDGQALDRAGDVGADRHFRAGIRDDAAFGDDARRLGFRGAAAVSRCFGVRVALTCTTVAMTMSNPRIG